MIQFSIFKAVKPTIYICRKLTIRQNSKWSYFNNPGNQPLVGETVGQALDRSVEKHADKEAVVFCQNKIRKSYAELNSDVNRFAAGLLALGLKKDERIGIWSPNYYEWLVTQYASAKAGLILVFINPAYQPRELEYCLTKVGIRAIVASDTFKTQDYYKILSTVIKSLAKSKPGEIKDKFESIKHIIMISNKNYGGTYNFSDVYNYGQNSHFQQLKKLEKTIQFDDPVFIMFTSGTTGSPKGATLTHFGVINNSYINGRILEFNKKIHRICLPTPLYHALGNITGGLSSILYGSCQVFPAPSYNAEATAKAVYEEKCTFMFGTPTMFIDILNLQNIDKYPFVYCRSGLMAGSTCPEEILKACISKLKMSNIFVGYGSTECSPAITSTSITDNFKESTTTVGKILGHTEVKLVDPISLRIVPIGTPGELWVRGYLVMQKYWNDEEKTNECITSSRWYRTGDLATFDENGYLKIVGRIKDTIIRGGENIYPREIEEFLHTHTKIAEAHIVGVPDKRLGEQLCAWVRLKLGKKLKADELKAFCKGQISHFKIPKYIKFVDNFPLTESGKVKKYVIRQKAKEELKLNGEKNDIF